MKHTRRLKRTAYGGILLTSTVLLFMMMAGNALAVTDSVFVHSKITLRDACGTAINSGSGLQAAFSAKETCGVCHNGSMLDSNGNPLLSYDNIEQHAYHAQMSANELVGWNTANPAATGNFAGFRKGNSRGCSPCGKRWVQSLGHFGKW